MTHRSLSTTAKSFHKKLSQGQVVVAKATKWESHRGQSGLPAFNSIHKKIFVEFAFLKAYLAWEAYLEEAFIHYLLGATPPRGKPARRLISPQRRSIAERLVNEGRDFTDWTKASLVVDRAERYFHKGRPFDCIRVHQGVLDNMRTIRNCIVHASITSQTRFSTLVRNELGTFPPGTTVGEFLDRLIPRNSPSYRNLPAGAGPTTYLEYYLSILEKIALKIVKL